MLNTWNKSEVPTSRMPPWGAKSGQDGHTTLAFSAFPYAQHEVKLRSGYFTTAFSGVFY